MLEGMEAQGIVERSGSPWASRIVLMRKKDGPTCFGVDYIKLNITQKDGYPESSSEKLKWYSEFLNDNARWQSTHAKSLICDVNVQLDTCSYAVMKCL